MAITEKQINFMINAEKLRSSEYDRHRVPLQRENNIRDLIRTGKYREIHLQPFSSFEGNLGRMAEDRFTQFTYLTVSAVAIWSRTALEGGAQADDVFDLSDALLYHLSYAKTIDEINQIYELAAIMFAKLVHVQMEKKPSYQVAQIQNYISRNIYQKITLEDIAGHLDLSANYLSNLFARETGIPLHSYIQQEKVKVACNLLENTPRPVSDIASYLGFQTPSHFASVFRRWAGMTPTEYRALKHTKVL